MEAGFEVSDHFLFPVSQDVRTLSNVFINMSASCCLASCHEDNGLTL